MSGRSSPCLRVASITLCVAAMLLVGGACEPASRSHAGMTEAAALVEEWVDEGRIPGAVLSVWHRGEPLFLDAFGHAQTHAYGRGQYRTAWPASPEDHGIEALPRPVPMTVGTVFDLASVTKVLATTMAVALSVDDGVLELSAPVRDYLPDFEGGGKEDITVEHLLTHTSGLPQWKPVYYHAGRADQAYAYVRSTPLEWAVGAGRHYSDLGFMVLGRLVEAVQQAPLDRFLQERLYDPLGLTATGFRGNQLEDTSDDALAATSHGNPFEHRMVHDLDFGYRIEGDPTVWDGWRRHTLRGEVNDGNAHHAFQGVAGHAGLFSTAEELQVLLGVFLNDGEWSGRRHLDRATVQRFLTQAAEGQALGWQLPEYAPAGSFAHSGFTGTFVMGVPAHDLGIVLLTNRQNGGVDANAAYPDVGPLQRGVVELLTR